MTTDNPIPETPVRPRVVSFVLSNRDDNELIALGDDGRMYKMDWIRFPEWKRLPPLPFHDEDKQQQGEHPQKRGDAK